MFLEALYDAIGLVIQRDENVYEIVWLSLKVSGSAVLIAALFGLPTGAVMIIFRFPGRQLLLVLLHALMGMPPVVVGLIVYLMLSHGGLFGPMQLLYTPTAMIIAQTILVFPIVAVVGYQSIGHHAERVSGQLIMYGLSRVRLVGALLMECRFSLSTAVLAGMGRALAEVGAVIIVGGNIHHETRVMTSAITLETAKGELASALSLGIILLVISLVISVVVYSWNRPSGIIGSSIWRSVT